MKIAVGILTCNARSGGRIGLLEQTIKSLSVAFPSALLLLYENGGNPGIITSPCYKTGVVEVGWGNGKPGAGRNRLLTCIESFDLCVRYGVDLVVMSDDDMRWHEDAAERICGFWSGDNLPKDVVLLGGLWEPEWAWNRPLSVVESGGQKALVRESVPAAAWSFPFSKRYAIFPLAEVASGEDVMACERTRATGHRVAAMDLADHIGRGFSLTGNNPPKGTPIDRGAWGL